MTDKEIKNILGKIISDILDGKLDRKLAVNQLIQNINPKEIYNSNDFEISDCYFAIKHLSEEGDETLFKEIEYFDECLNGNRKYSLDEKNLYLKEYLDKKL